VSVPQGAQSHPVGGKGRTKKKISREGGKILSRKRAGTKVVTIRKVTCERKPRDLAGKEEDFNGTRENNFAV